MRRIVVYGCAFFMLLLALAASAGEQIGGASEDRAAEFFKASEAYKAGRYPTAAEGFERLVMAGIESGYLYYNLGNARLRGGDLPGAIVAYLHAQWLLPRSEDVRVNLRFARKTRTDQIDAASSAMWRSLFFWHFKLAPRELLMALLLSNGIFWLVLCLRLYIKNNEMLEWLKWLALAGIVSFTLSFAWKTFLPPQVVVVKAAEVKVYSGTDRDSVVRFVLHAGSEAAWTATDGEWLQVELADGKRGWILHDNVEAFGL